MFSIKSNLSSSASNSWSAILNDYDLKMHENLINVSKKKKLIYTKMSAILETIEIITFEKILFYLFNNISWIIIKIL